MTGQSIFGWTRVAVAATALLGLLAVAAMAILLWQPAPALAQSPPDAVGSITLTRSGSTLTVSWNAVRRRRQVPRPLSGRRRRRLAASHP